ncbi:DegT/DnrJ/EryC1/StrS family aminotransferase [Ferrovum myxofaciens]|uniref:DegT/DnrJ/EryC1/StrS family aminotransferase n=1 Tax=Ferrovum myxofaciens TaxID=416213 RepID=A0A9E6MVP2_9PROT|nr:DegT/DnrJ/EryC1/StrS family aminotransferase [Ferrovum myxofaciens]QKE39224.2 MAG: DegT/DnrJ/EryC1/StrS family aminotransferase [Ferrovum myxofaciens]QWY74482.1 MAG: DegT/DnrJ/EryC1/StrS family aminotransferase [Ferrovum myxofaciens]QWY77230.1 MAG: DegT/DnrJ/EryC1/StrS family aminotransferase [Ferrovum myxofaciens]
MTFTPPEHIPKQPVFDLLALTGSSKGSPSPPSLRDAPYQCPVNRGSLAIALALRHIGLSGRKEVLVPAYHCGAMIEPILAEGGIPIFYRIRADTTVDLEDMARRRTPATRVVLVPHFFGFLQPLQAVRAWCDAHDLILIEDCAHAFFGETEGCPVGTQGDYAIGSTWKFFPLNEGGCLVSFRHPLNTIKTRAPSLSEELKAVVNTLEYASTYGRLGSFNALFKNTFHLKDWLVQRLRSEPPSLAPPHKSGDAPTPEDFVPAPFHSGFDPKRTTLSGSLWARWVTEKSSLSFIVEKRRENYQTLLEASVNLPGCHPLFPHLPEGIVPHVFPLVMDQPLAVFGKLKFAGVPIIRFGEFLWDKMEKGTCPISEDYSRRIFQFPCHQSLQKHELNWMIQVLSAVLTGSGSLPSHPDQHAP